MSRHGPPAARLGTMLDEEAVPAPLSGMARYEKGIVLGEGTFGVVFKANDRLVRTPRLSSPAAAR